MLILAQVLKEKWFENHGFAHSQSTTYPTLPSLFPRGKKKLLFEVIVMYNVKDLTTCKKKTCGNHDFAFRLVDSLWPQQKSSVIKSNMTCQP